jgi:hypothetical protein
MRRFTRLTNAFSKKVDNHCHALALYFVFYNFVRIHRRCASRQRWKVSDRLWSMEDVVALIDAAEGEPKKRGPYKPRHPAEIFKVSHYRRHQLLDIALDSPVPPM